MINFWTKLKKPIYALAPMAGITDSAFRQMCKSFGTDVVYSEMASATALVYNPKKTLEMLSSDKKEAPYVVQLFGSNPEHFVQAVKVLTDKKRRRLSNVKCQMSIAGLDINFGCPVKKVAKQGAGAVLMNDLKLAKRIIRAVMDNTDLPVSIKIRAKVGEVSALKFLDSLKDLPIAAVMIHGRTLAQGHAGEVDWQMIRRARQSFGGVILANGGVVDRASALDLLEKTQADGVGIGQGALGKPWIFSELKISNFQFLISKEDLFKVVIQHAKLVHKLKGNNGIKEMRKHLCWYVTGLPNASELRRELVKVESLKEITQILR